MSSSKTCSSSQTTRRTSSQVSARRSKTLKTVELFSRFRGEKFMKPAVSDDDRLVNAGNGDHLDLATFLRDYTGSLIWATRVAFPL